MSVLPPSLHDEETFEPEALEEDSVLVRSVKLRFPRLRDKSQREKIEALEDHIAETAIMRGELAELRLHANLDLKDAQLSWEELQVATSGKSQAEAKRRARPDLHKTIKEARWLVDRCTEEIERMDADYTSASREYTVVTGS
jgi:hypothetical protein